MRGPRKWARFECTLVAVSGVPIGHYIGVRSMAVVLAAALGLVLDPDLFHVHLVHPCHVCQSCEIPEGLATDPCCCPDLVSFLPLILTSLTLMSLPSSFAAFLG